MPVALILGTSRGIGLEFARQYRADGWRVVATTRSDDGQRALEALGAEVHRLDLTDPTAVAALGWKIDGEAFDAAIYCAGVMGMRTHGIQPVHQDNFDTVMRTNVLGPMMALPIILPAVEAATQARGGKGGALAVLSSRMASLGEMESNSNWLYRASKAALNVVVKATALEAQQATVVALHPGWVRTDMGGPLAEISPKRSVTEMRIVLAEISRAHNGAFLNHDGNAIPW